MKAILHIPFYVIGVSVATIYVDYVPSVTDAFLRVPFRSLLDTIVEGVNNKGVYYSSKEEIVPTEAAAALACFLSDLGFKLLSIKIIKVKNLNKCLLVLKCLLYIYIVVIVVEIS